MTNKNIERKIIIGLIASTEFISQIRDVYNSRLILSSMAKRLAAWSIEHFDKYGKAPGMSIIDIYYEKLKKGLPKDLAEEIEQDILPDLNEEFLQEGIDVPHLTDQTRAHFSEKNLELFTQQITAAIEEGDIGLAESLATNFKTLTVQEDSSVNFMDESSLEIVKQAFVEAGESLIYFPKQLGHFWNHQFVDGSFVAFLAPEKRGKTFLLMEIAKRGVSKGYPVAFFQAGDMSEKQQIRRFCINLTKNSDLERYCGEMYEPVRDCVHNQRGTCEKAEREGDGGVFDDLTELQIRKELSIEDLKEAYENNPEYKPCYNCKEYKTRPIGSPWVRKIVIPQPLDENRAAKAWEKYFIKNKRSLRLSTHANGTLTTEKAESILDYWEKKHKFIPRIIIFDYADIMACKEKIEFRHQQNQIWKNLRAISQKERGGHLPLVITVTQADADSYSTDLIKTKNFSEDKRKYAHVTAMYGLNQDHTGREKKIGIMRVNELVIREGDFDISNVCHILQNLKRGQPFLSSYF